jgi:hypothetical protein
LTERHESDQGRRSALTVGLALVAIAAWHIYRSRPVPAVLLGAGGGILLAVGAAFPRAAAQFHHWWMRLAAVLGYVNSRVLLTIIYFLVIAPVGALARLTGHDALQRHGGAQPSYWIKRASSRQTARSFERAF